MTYCTVSAFRLHMLCLYHVMFCLQSHQNIVQHERRKGKKINQYHIHRFFHKPKMSSFKSPYLTPNYHSTHVERYSGKTRLLNQWRHLMFLKWKYIAREKIGVKVDWFLKIVWKISNLNKSRRLIYKKRNFLTSGFEIYAICLGPQQGFDIIGR